VALAVLGILLLGGCSRKEDPTSGPGATGEDQPAAVTTAVARGTRAVSGASLTGIPDAGAVPEPSPAPQVYVVKAGDTLSAIAARFDCMVDDLVRANQITNPNALQVGQKLTIPTTFVEAGPSTRLLPNSEFVNSPAYVDFDIAAFCARSGGYLCQYEENVDGQVLSGPEIVNLVVHRYSLGPRLLLAILEMQGGWLTDPNPTGQALYSPLGRWGGGQSTFHLQLAWAADKLNEGYYNWRGRGMPLKLWGDGTSTRYASSLNAATAGLQYFFGLRANKNQWTVLVGEGEGSFIESYRQLFGDPAQYAIEPLIPADTTCPPLSLPWSQGELWFYTGGPHGAWNDGSAWAAIDFVPDEGYLGCQAASSSATAAAAGLVVYNQHGEVVIDLDEDGHEETGWVLFYLHVASQDRVAVGTRVRQGDPIGHPSCEGGFSKATHLHLARKYNGEWIAADGPLPLVLSGWQFHSAGTDYVGTATRGGEERSNCECWRPKFNGLSHE
jgi:LysM repeat protein